jgi:hypothetical protein
VCVDKYCKDVEGSGLREYLWSHVCLGIAIKLGEFFVILKVRANVFVVGENELGIIIVLRDSLLG